MAETGGFPDSHTTPTDSTATTQQTASPGVSCTIDKGYATSVPGIIRIVEIIFGLLYWTVVASNSYPFDGYSYVLFVAVTAWVFTVILFILFLLSLTKQVTIISWVVTDLINDVADFVLHFIAALFISRGTGEFDVYAQRGVYDQRGVYKLILGCVCGWILVGLYALSAFFSNREFQAMGGFDSLCCPCQAANTTTTTTTTTTVVEQPPDSVDEKGQNPPPS